MCNITHLLGFTIYLLGWKAKPFPHLRGVFWSLSVCFCHSMLATNIVKICHWLFPLCIRVIWPETIVLSTKQIPDCWLQGLRTYGVFCLWMMAIFQANAGHYWPGCRRGWQYWGHTAQLAASGAGVCLCRSQTEWPRLCVMCQQDHCQHTEHNLTWMIPSTLSKHMQCTMENF